MFDVMELLKAMVGWPTNKTSIETLRRIQLLPTAVQKCSNEVPLSYECTRVVLDKFAAKVRAFGSDPCKDLQEGCNLGFRYRAEKTRLLRPAFTAYEACATTKFAAAMVPLLTKIGEARLIAFGCLDVSDWKDPK